MHIQENKIKRRARIIPFGYKLSEDTDYIEPIESELEALEEDEEEVDNIDPEEMDGVEYKTFRYDLCSKCHSRYMQDPLSINSIRRGRFSEN